MISKIVDFAIKVAKNKYVWVFTVAFIFGASRGTVQYIDKPIEVEKKVEVPVERVVYKNTDDAWKRLNDIDEEIFDIRDDQVGAYKSLIAATGKFFGDFDSDALAQAIEKTSVRVEAGEKQLIIAKARRTEIIKGLETDK